MKNGGFPLSVQGARFVLLSVSQIEVKILLDCDGLLAQYNTNLILTLKEKYTVRLQLIV